MRFHFLYVVYVLHRTHGRQDPTRVPEVGIERVKLVTHTVGGLTSPLDVVHS